MIEVIPMHTMMAIQVVRYLIAFSGVRTRYLRSQASARAISWAEGVGARCDDVSHIVADEHGTGSDPPLGATGNVGRREGEEQHIPARGMSMTKAGVLDSESTYGAPKHGSK